MGYRTEKDVLGSVRIDSKDNWQVHFSDTMVEGVYLSNWRMAELNRLTGHRFKKSANTFAAMQSEHAELDARDVVARSIYYEIQVGRGTEHGGVYLDISQKGADFIKKKLPGMYSQFKEFALSCLLRSCQISRRSAPARKLFLEPLLPRARPCASLKGKRLQP